MASDSDNWPSGYPCRVEGWLNVWELTLRNNSSRKLDGSVPLIVWEPCFCVLLENRKRLAHFRTEKQAEELYKPEDHRLAKVRIDSGKDDFDKRWGYTALESIKENVLQQEHLATGSLEAFHQRAVNLDTDSISSQCSDSAYEKNVISDRRGSVPAVCGQQQNLDTLSTPSKIANFFSRRVKSNLKRTKSVTKLDRRKGVLNNDTDRALINQRIRASRSHESLLQITTPSSMHSIDLSASDIEIKPLHSSILGQEHCFQVSTANGSKFYSCRSAEERQRWIEHLRKTVEPTQEKSRRTENSLKLWILEAKNLPVKKRYFCELCLDGTLYARTSSKIKGDMLFWGEQFDFTNLPPIKTITINLYREADRKKKKEKNVLLAYINISAAEVNKRHLVEHWYTLSSATVGKAGRESKCEQPLLRVKARYQTINILPMELYEDFIHYIETEYSLLVEILEPHIGVRAKDELATALVHILERRHRAKDFLTDIVMAEVDKLDNDNLTFRGNSIATKAMEAYLKLVGEKYLQETLGDFIKTALESGDDCEVDPVKVPNNATLQRQQKNLTTYCQMAWFKIVNSHCFFPSELRAVFSDLRERCVEKKRADLADNLISSCIFLRFLCPSILSPSLFNLTHEFPSEKGARNLTLVAKTIQCLANFTKFGGKEEFMTFMNEFVENELPNAQMFIQQISRPDVRDVAVRYDGYIDLGKELSTLHTVLSECVSTLHDGARLKLSALCEILDDITDAQNQPVGGTERRHQPAQRPSALDGSRGIYDNLLTSDDVRPTDADKTTVASTADVSGGGGGGVVLELCRQYEDARLSRSADDMSGVPYYDSDRRAYQSTDDYVRYTQLDEAAPTQLSVSVSPSVDADYSRRPEEKHVNRCWSKMLEAADTVVNGGVGVGAHVDLIRFVDDEDDESADTDVPNSSLDSAGQLSAAVSASSGYQSYGGRCDSPGAGQPRPQHHQQPLSFSNPLFGHGDTVGAVTSRRTPTDLALHSPSSSSLSSDDAGQTHLARPHQASHGPPTAGSLDRRHRPTDPDRRPYHRQCATHRHQHHDAGLQQPTAAAAAAAAESALTPTRLSRSVDLTSALSPSTQGMRRALTEAAILTAPTSPHFGTLPPTWRATSSTTQQMSSAENKTKEQYEEELSELRRQLAQTQVMLAETQQRLFHEEEHRQRIMSEMKHVLQSRETTLQEQVTDKQGQIEVIMSRLQSVEDTHRHDSDKLRQLVSERERRLLTQDDTIRSLDSANDKLLSALTQLRERATVHAHNGLTSPRCLSLDNSDGGMKQSSC